MSPMSRSVKRVRGLYRSLCRRSRRNERRLADPLAGRVYFRGVEQLQPRLLLSANLLANSGGETGGLDDWEISPGSPVAAVTSNGQSTGRVYPHEGDYLFSFAACGGGTHWLSQTGTTGLDGDVLTMFGRVQTEALPAPGEGDYGKVTLSILDADDSVLATHVTPELHSGGLNWQQFTFDLTVPEGAASWRLEVAGIRDYGWAANVFYDDLALYSDPPTGPLVVNSLADNTDVDGLVTLREAVYAANSDLPVGDAPAGSGADVIQFDPSLAGGTITMAGVDLDIPVAEDLTIVGLGTDQLTIDANDGTRHFEVNDGVSLTMSGLTLANGNAGEGGHGGAIYCEGDLYLSDVVVTSNRAGGDGGAIYAKNGTVTLTDCLIRDGSSGGQGGGVAQYGGVLDITGTTFARNDISLGGSRGGAVYTDATTTITNSRFEENTAQSDGGAILADYTLDMTDGEFEGNFASRYGGAIQAYNALDAQRVEFTSNSAGSDGGAVRIYNDYPATFLQCTFVTNHSDAQGGAVYQRNHRSSRYDDCTFTENDADLHGGAIFGSGGSVEVVDSLFTGNHVVYDGGAFNGHAIHTIDSTLDGNYTESRDGGALHVWNHSTIQRTTFTNNVSGRHGGAINQAAQELWVGHSTFESNRASGYGGALRSVAETVISDSTFRLNQTPSIGGAMVLYGDYNTFTIDGCLIEQNAAGVDGNNNDGGGIWSDAHRVTVQRTVIQDNTATRDGGGIWAKLGQWFVTDSVIANNHAGSAGGIYILVGSVELVNSTLSGNTADVSGGGVLLNNGSQRSTIINSTITGNRSDADGDGNGLAGGLAAWTEDQDVLVHNSIIAGNFAGTGADASDVHGLLNPASSHNIIADAASAGGLTHGVNDNLVGVDPMLGPLADNGGNSSIHALLPGSPAIDSGDNALALSYDGEALWYDQRGYDFDRVVGLHVDRGAYEVQTPGAEIHGRKGFDLDRDGSEDETWGANIVVNGGFEEGNLGSGDWYDLRGGYMNLTRCHIHQSVQSINVSYSDPAEGSRFVDLNQNLPGSISQVLITEPGRRYRLTFELSGLATGYPGVKTLEVSAGGASEQYIFDTTGRDPRDMGWQTKTWEFVA